VVRTCHPRPRGKHFDAAELRVVVAAVLAVATDAVLVAKHLLKLGAHLVTALARLQVYNQARRNSLEAGSMRETQGEEERRNVRNYVWQFGTGNRKRRWHANVYPEQENQVILPLLPLELWAPCKARWVWAGAVIFSSAACSLQFAKAKTAALSQQKKGNSADLQRGRVNIPGFISPTHKRTEGRAPVWGSEFTSKRHRTTGGDPAETAVG
jgi:hypothetical protein